MASSKYLSFVTCNLYNINEPELPIYRDRDGWSRGEYWKKIDWLAHQLAGLSAHVFGFQELWHQKSLEVAFEEAGLGPDYTLLIPHDHKGEKISCAGAVKKDLLNGDPEWIETFPDALRLDTAEDQDQTPAIKVTLDRFSRPVLHFKIRPPRANCDVSVYVAHFKSKSPTKIYRETWYREDEQTYKPHQEAIGSALSTIRRTAEATALRLILTSAMKDNDHPVVVMGDLNDGQGSNTLNILTGQPRYLSGLSTGGGDTDLYSAEVLQEYRSRRDVYYTHIHQDYRESLDHILVSQEFYDNSKRRIWAFKQLTVTNDHLNGEKHKESGTTDHGIVKALFKYKPVAD